MASLKIHDLVVNKAAKYKEASKGDKLSAEDINEMMKKIDIILEFIKRSDK